jgi:hypothetical protein
VMPSDIGLLAPCAQFTLNHARNVEKDVLQELQTSAATRLVVALRVIRLQKTILATGMFSLYESFLQVGMGWQERFAFNELEKCLKKHGEYKLAEVFSDYRLAVNVLKHGKGESYDRLVKRSSELEFKIKLPDDAFVFEGDVSELGSVLIDVHDKFVERCAEIIQETLAVLRSKEEKARFL